MWRIPMKLNSFFQIFFCSSFLLNCAGVGFQEFDEIGKVGTVEVPLCTICSTPYNYQIEKAKTLMQKTCANQQVIIIREATKHLPDAVWGSTFQYYWKCKCARGISPNLREFRRSFQPYLRLA